MDYRTLGRTGRKVGDTCPERATNEPRTSHERALKEGSVLYASINVFTVRAGAMDAFVALQRDLFVPLLHRQPGFVAFEVVRTGADTGVATLWWSSEEARLAATPALSVWVKEHLEPYVAALDNPSGPVVVSSRGASSALA